MILKVLTALFHAPALAQAPLSPEEQVRREAIGRYVARTPPGKYSSDMERYWVNVALKRFRDSQQYINTDAQ